MTASMYLQKLLAVISGPAVVFAVFYYLELMRPSIGDVPLSQFHTLFTLLAMTATFSFGANFTVLRATVQRKLTQNMLLAAFFGSVATGLLLISITSDYEQAAYSNAAFALIIVAGVGHAVRAVAEGQEKFITATSLKTMTTLMPCIAIFLLGTSIRELALVSVVLLTVIVAVTTIRTVDLSGVKLPENRESQRKGWLINAVFSAYMTSFLYLDRLIVKSYASDQYFIDLSLTYELVGKAGLLSCILLAPLFPSLFDPLMRESRLGLVKNLLLAMASLLCLLYGLSIFVYPEITIGDQYRLKSIIAIPAIMTVGLAAVLQRIFISSAHRHVYCCWYLICWVIQIFWVIYASCRSAPPELILLVKGVLEILLLGCCAWRLDRRRAFTPAAYRFK
ncbi:hypothetical protein N9H10_03995 [Luminiphilus sp.]|nr:hypothetical protein [Luminiphilus sp.]MDA8986213.1 hypothetical protein [Luminiphilus sp.]